MEWTKEIVSEIIDMYRQRPCLWKIKDKRYYKLLLFTRDQDTPLDTLDNVESFKCSNPQDTNYDQNNDEDVLQDLEASTSTGSTGKQNTLVRLKQPFENNKKRKNESESDMREFVKACTTTLNTPEKEYDEFDNICMAFAAKMRKMDPIQQIWTESLMHKIVTYGLLGKLNDNMDIVDTGYNS
uniref:Uncharacterized protein LOC114332164 n=1 Tax=Diabrotica virgifera virgifera TaxID=50390 RepID=A0A6P7FN27_DIAVI